MNSELTLADYLRTLRRRWPLIVVSFGVVLIATVLYTALTPPTYESTATVLLRTQTTDPLFPPVGRSETSTFLREPVAEGEFVQTSEFTTLAEERSPAGVSVRTVVDDDVRVFARSPTIEFVATGDTPTATQLAAQAWADTYLATRASSDVAELSIAIETIAEQIAELESEKAAIVEPLQPIDDALLAETDTDAITRLTAQRLAIQDTLEDQLLPITFELRTLTTELSRLRITESFVQVEGVSARTGQLADPGVKVSPQTMRNVLLGSVLGLALGVAVALMLESVRTAIVDRNDVESLLGKGTVLAEVPLLTSSPREPTGSGADQYHAEIERVVSTVVQAIASSHDRSRILVTSSKPSEGKTTLSWEIARRLGLGEFRTLLIDADLRRPTLHSYFGLSNRRSGLSDALQSGEERPRIRAAQIKGNEHLRFLSAGTPTEESSRLLRTNLGSVLDRVPDEVAVVIDSPPTLALPDAEVIASHTDWVIIVARIGESNRTELATTAERIEASSADLLGVVLIGAEVTHRGYSYYTVRDDDDAAPTSAEAEAPGPSTLDAEPVSASPSPAATVEAAFSAAATATMADGDDADRGRRPRPRSDNGVVAETDDEPSDGDDMDRPDTSRRKKRRRLGRSHSSDGVEDDERADDNRR